MLAKIDHSINAQPETYAFKINGYCHHVMGFLLPINNEAQSLLNYMFLTLRMRFIIGLSHLPRKTFRRPWLKLLFVGLWLCLILIMKWLSCSDTLNKDLRNLTVPTSDFACLVREIMAQDITMIHLLKKLVVWSLETLVILDSIFYIRWTT